VPKVVFQRSVLLPFADNQSFIVVIKMTKINSKEAGVGPPYKICY